MEKNREFIKRIDEVLEVVDPTTMEFSKPDDLTFLDKYITGMINTSKMDNKRELYDILSKIAIGSGNEDRTYGTATYESLNEDERDVVRDIFEGVASYAENDTAYAKNILNVEKILGLMAIRGDKDPQDYKYDKSVFLEKDVWNKISSENIAEFPQFIKQFDPLEDIHKRVYNAMNTIVKEMTLMKDRTVKRTFVDLLMLADMGASSSKLLRSLSVASARSVDTRSSGRKGKFYFESDDDRVKVDNEYLDQLETKLSDLFIEKLKVSARDADTIARAIVKEMESEKDGYIVELKKLAEGNFRGLECEEDIIFTSANTILYYMDEKMTRDEKLDAFIGLLPIAYVSTMKYRSFGDMFDVRILDDARVTFPDVDRDWEYDRMLMRSNDITVDDAVRIDYLIGSSMCTFFYGVVTKEPFYKTLSSNVMLSLSEDFIINKMSARASDFNQDLVRRFLRDMMKNFQDADTTIDRAANAIYLALTDR